MFITHTKQVEAIIEKKISKGGVHGSFTFFDWQLPNSHIW